MQKAADRHEAAAADALERTRQNECDGRARQGAENRCKQEQDDGRKQQRPPAEPVGAFAVDRRCRRRCQQIGRNHPGQVDAAWQAGHLRNGGHHHRLVQCGKQDAGEHAHLPGIRKDPACCHEWAVAAGGSTLRAIISPIGMAEVAAGDGALQTCSMRSVSRNRKSCASVPSRMTA